MKYSEKACIKDSSKQKDKCVHLHAGLEQECHSR